MSDSETYHLKKSKLLKLLIDEFFIRLVLTEYSFEIFKVVVVFLAVFLKLISEVFFYFELFNSYSFCFSLACNVTPSFYRK